MFYNCAFLAKASVKFAGRNLDAELFVVKHLLILREQTSPYHFRSTAKKQQKGSSSALSRSNSIGNVSVVEAGGGINIAAMPPQFDYSLDLGRYRHSMAQLLSAENRGRWFELSSNNALLSFLLAVIFY